MSAWMNSVVREHKTSVTNAHGKGAGGHIVIRGFRAHCSCGLLGKTRDTHAKANRDVSDHRLVAPLEDEIVTLRAGLLRIARGNWNFGNLEPGLTVMEFARRVLDER